MFGKSRLGRRAMSRVSQRTRLSGFVEALEPRLMLAGAPPDIVVGRTLSSYFVGGVQDSQETLSFTIYNEQADPITGVLLTDTLKPGVTLVNASIVPDQSGQNLAWSLGTLDGFARASVTVTVQLANAGVLTLDEGAQAFGTLDAGAVSNSTVAASLRAGNPPDPTLSASTPDANTSDPFIQEEAAKLNYEPQQIFDFLHNEIGYQSYFGSLRGARGALWNSAGNSLDVASLGVALMRASGIPAQYVSGTLAKAQAQELILSMFPAPERISGLVNPGIATADPVHDPALMAQAQDHTWFQFDAGGGFVDADPLIAGAQLGQTFATAANLFAEVPDALRHKVRIQLNAEFYNSSSSLFGGGLEQTTVLDGTHNTVDLVGRSLTLGNYISSQASGGLVSAQTNTYSPYVILDENDGNIDDDQIFRGIDYQEVLTNFPLASRILTGLFLVLTSEDPQIGGQQSDTSVTKTLFDRIGVVARETGSATSISTASQSGPALTPFDLVTIAVTPGRQLDGPLEVARAGAVELSTTLGQILDSAAGAPLSDADRARSDHLTEEILAVTTSTLAGTFLLRADEIADQYADGMLTKSYVDSARFVVVQSSLLNPTSDNAQVQLAFDILRDPRQALPYPGQNAQLAQGYRGLMGLTDGAIESQVLSELGTEQGAVQTSAFDVYQAAINQNIPLVCLDAGDETLLSGLNVSAEAKARIELAIRAGKQVVVPNGMATVNGGASTAWLEIDPATGSTSAVMENGLHGAAYTQAGLLGGLAILLSDVTEGAALLAYGFTRQFISRYAFNQFLTAKSLLQLQSIMGNMVVRVSAAIRANVANRTVQVLAIKGAIRGIQDAYEAAKRYLKFDPEVGQYFLSQPPSADFAQLGDGTSDSPAVGIIRDPFFTVPFHGAELPTAFLVGIKNVTPAADDYQIEPAGVPAGFNLQTSVSTIHVSSQDTAEVGLYLVPVGPLPPPGVDASFSVRIRSLSNPALSTTVNVPLVMPEIHAVSLSIDPVGVSTAPGATAPEKLLVTNAGNVPELNVTFATNLPPGMQLAGLTPISLAAGQSMTETFTVTPDAGTPLNSLLDPTITASFGSAATPQMVTLDIPVSVVVPGAAAIGDAANAAGQLGQPSLALRLTDLAASLTNLVQDPTSAIYKKQSLDNIDSILSQLAADPFLSKFTSALNAARNELDAAADAGQIQIAVNDLGSALTNLDTVLRDAAAHRFTASLSPNSQVAQPTVPTQFGIVLQNTGSQTTTYDLSLADPAALPPGVTSSLSQTSITLDPGQTTGTGNVPSVFLTLTETDPTQLVPFGFQVTVTPETAPELGQSLSGTMTARTQIVSVVSVASNPPFADAGTQVDITARVLNAVNRQQQAEVSYTIKDSSNQTVFTLAQPVLTTLNVQASLVTVDLGMFDTTGLANGQYSIDVTVSDSDGNPIPGASGEGTLLIGSPVTATESISPSVLPPGSGTVTTTLEIKSHIQQPPSLSLIGQVAISGGVSGIALYSDATHHLAYVGGDRGTAIVDVSDPTNPVVVSPFFGTTGDILLQVVGNDLFVRTGSSASGQLQVYSLADPLHPAFISGLGIGYQFTHDFVLQGTHEYMSLLSFRYNIFSNTITDQNGDLLSIDVSNPAQPFLAGELFSGAPGNNEPFGGNYNMWQMIAVDPTTLLVGSTTATGSDITGTGGRVLVVSTANPAAPTVLRELDIPQMVHVIGIAQEGNRALVVGSSGGWDPTYGLTGHIVLGTLDLTDPENPTLISTQDLTRASRGMGFLTDLGNNLFASSSLGTPADQPEILLIDASNPANLVVSQMPTDDLNDVRNFAVSGSDLYSGTASGLFVHQIGTVQSTPVTVEVTVPTNTGVAVVPNSFNIPPTTITHGVAADTLDWDLSFASGNASQTITWQSQVTGLQPGESRAVSEGGTVNFTDQGTSGQIALPPLDVAGQHILSLTPASQTMQPAAPAAYTVTVSNPTNAPVTYSLAVQGVPSGWVGLPSSVQVGPNASMNVPLQLTSDSFAALGQYGFTVVASAAGGVSDSVGGDLILAGVPAIQAQTKASGVVAALTPSQATAGVGTTVSYVLRLTNTGSADDTYSLSMAGLPASVTAVLGQNSVEVPPGASNFRDVTLTLTPQPGTTPADYNFSVTSTSTSEPSTSAKADATLTVLASGVSVALSPPSGAPGTTFQMTVKNLGQAQDTFDLALAGPAAVAANLGASSVTLAPGASQIISITTGSANFADAGALALTAIATSHTSAAVQGTASAALNIPVTHGITAKFEPASQLLSQPGEADFLLNVQNLGNADDAYSVAIVGTSRPIAASLVGLDGTPTATIPVVDLFGLASGSISLKVTATDFGQGTVTAKVTSLIDPSITSTITATLTVAAPITFGNLLLLSPRSKGALTVSGNGSVSVPDGSIIVDSSRAKAIIDSGNATLSASEIDVTGGIFRTGHGHLVGMLKTGVTPLADPLSSLPVPQPTGPSDRAIHASGKKAITLSPGTYNGGIHATGNASITLLPGIYYLQGGGLSVSGNAKLTGDGVMIYNAPHKFSDDISVSGRASVTLSAASSGTYQSIAVFQNRTSKAPIAISSGNVSVNGMLYAAAAHLKVNSARGVNVTAMPADGISTGIVVASLSVVGHGVLLVGTATSEVHSNLLDSIVPAAALPIEQSFQTSPTTARTHTGEVSLTLASSASSPSWQVTASGSAKRTITRARSSPTPSGLAEVDDFFAKFDI
jgi:large repetitive protein